MSFSVSFFVEGKVVKHKNQKKKKKTFNSVFADVTLSSIADSL